jgi:hypothetical protein
MTRHPAFKKQPSVLRGLRVELVPDPLDPNRHRAFQPLRPPIFGLETRLSVRERRRERAQIRKEK